MTFAKNWLVGSFGLVIQRTKETIHASLKFEELFLHLPTFSESNVWDFHLVMTGISKIVKATSKDPRWFPEDTRTLPKMSEDVRTKWFPVPQIQMQTETWKFACCDKVRAQSQHKVPFGGKFKWIFVINHVLENNLSGFVSQAWEIVLNAWDQCF